MSSFQKKKKLWGLQKQGSVTHIWAEKRKYLVKTEYDEVQRQNVADKNFRATENTQIMQTLFKELNTNMMKMAPWVGNLNKNIRITKK